MEDQLRILTTIVSLSARKHGADKPLTLGHLLNICRLAQKYETKIAQREIEEHETLLNEISTMGQD